MINVDTIEIDGINYLIIKSIKKDNNEYFLLGNLENPNDFMVAKTVVVDGEDYISEIVDDEEYNKAIEIFAIKK